MSQDPILLFYTTVSSREMALPIAKSLLEKRLVACANILPAHTALYYWNEKLQTENEHILILKTTQTRALQVESELKHLHPYESPCLLQFEASASNQKFYDWVKEQTN